VSKRARRIAIASLAVVVVVSLVSMLDWARFYEVQAETPMIVTESARMNAMRDATASAKTGLVTTDPCVDPLLLKAVTIAAVTYVNVGMAWPDKFSELSQLNTARGEGVLALEWAEAGDVKWLVTDSQCSTDWASEYRSNLEAVKEVSYGDGSIILWKIIY
jgi:hypothetical protein